MFWKITFQNMLCASRLVIEFFFVTCEFSLISFPLRYLDLSDEGGQVYTGILTCSSTFVLPLPPEYCFLGLIVNYYNTLFGSLDAARGHLQYHEGNPAQMLTSSLPSDSDLSQSSLLSLNSPMTLCH